MCKTKAEIVRKNWLFVVSYFEAKEMNESNPINLSCERREYREGGMVLLQNNWSSEYNNSYCPFHQCFRHANERNGQFVFLRFAIVFSNKTIEEPFCDLLKKQFQISIEKQKTQQRQNIENNVAINTKDNDNKQTSW